MAKKEIYVFRHGEINTGSWYTYRPWALITMQLSAIDDPILSTNGLEQTKNIGRKLFNSNFTPKVIITSPYIRCIQTSTQIQSSYETNTPEIILSPILGEYQYYWKQICASYPFGIPEKHNNKIYEYPENKYNLKKRSIDILEEIINKYDNAIVVTHKSIVEQIIKCYLGDDNSIEINFADGVKIFQNDDGSFDVTIIKNQI